MEPRDTPPSQPRSCLPPLPPGAGVGVGGEAESGRGEPLRGHPAPTPVSPSVLPPGSSGCRNPPPMSDTSVRPAKAETASLSLLPAAAASSTSPPPPVPFIQPLQLSRLPMAFSSPLSAPSRLCLLSPSTPSLLGLSFPHCLRFPSFLSESPPLLSSPSFFPTPLRCLGPPAAASCLGWSLSQAQQGGPGQGFTGGPWEPRMRGHHLAPTQKGGGKGQ